MAKVNNAAAAKSIALDTADARRFMLRAQRFDGGFAELGGAIEHMGFVQMDPINVCGRMHDLILRNRVHNYAENGLLQHLYPESPTTPRSAFEHYLPGQGILVSLPLQAWPFLRPHMRYRARNATGFNGRLPRSERAIARRILNEIASRGALGAEDIDHDARATSGWGTQSRLVKVVLEKLFVHGEVLISTRRNFRRVYDLPERVLPAAVLAAAPESMQASQRWRLLQRLKQRRLGRIAAADLRLVDDQVQRVAVPQCPALYCLRSDLPLLDARAAEGASGGRLSLLAPLDPLIYDRVLTSRLWQFDYTWEVYTPPAKRVRGYYALPLLAGENIVGHVDPKADRNSGRLQVISRKLQRGYRSAEAVRELASFLGLRPPR